LIVALRVLVLWGVEVLVLRLLGIASIGIEVGGWQPVILTVALVGVLNALFRPLLLLITLPFTVLSLGFLTLLINTAVFDLAAMFVPGIEATFGASFVAALALAMANTIASAIFAFHEEDSVYRHIMRRLARVFRRTAAPLTPGLILVEIDGLAHPILERALQSGYMPTIRRLVRSGSYRLTKWDCGLPSQTSSAQAGILFGNSFDIPGFRWFDKSIGKLMQSNDPADVARMEQRLSRGTGLLRDGGASICNMFSGDADRCVATMSTLTPSEQVRKAAAVYFPYFVYPYNFTRTLMQIVAEIVIERWQGLRQRFRNEVPRVARGGSFPLLRAASTVFQRELGTYALMSEMFAGTPITYISYIGYDVVAHHAGPERTDSLRVLRSIDRRIALLLRCAHEAARPYRFVFLSDHGHTRSVPFRQRNGKAIETVVHELMRGERTVRAPIVKTQGWQHLRVLMKEALRHDQLSTRAAQRLLHTRARQSFETETGDVLLCPSGSLANLYFTTVPRRLDLADLAAIHPGLIEGLVAHPGIGFVMIRSATHGPVVTGRGGVCYLRDRRVEGEDPLAGYGPHVIEHLLRLDEFPHCGDIVLMGRYDAQAQEVQTFEEMVGAHGGLGGPQCSAFLLAPEDLPMPDTALTSAEEIYQLFVDWRNLLTRDDARARSMDAAVRDAL